MEAVIAKKKGVIFCQDRQGIFVSKGTVLFDNFIDITDLQI